MINSLPSRYENLTSYILIRHYDFDTLMERYGYRLEPSVGGEYLEDLAYRTLGDATIWWIIAAVNGFEIDALSPLAGGIQYKIPSKDVINATVVPAKRL